MTEIWWLKYLSLPCCGTIPELRATVLGGQVENGVLRCGTCDRTFPIQDGIIRLGEGSGYAASFSIEWQRFAETQIDHLNGTRISEDRLTKIAGGSIDFFDESVVYDAGCGAGRFSAVAAAHGARVIAADVAFGAVGACRQNTREFGNVLCVHASTNRRPVQESSVDVALSIGVYPSRRIRCATSGMLRAPFDPAVDSSSGGTSVGFGPLLTRNTCCDRSRDGWCHRLVCFP